MLTTQRRSHPAEARAAEMFQRVLAPWAMDMLRLRRVGLDLPSSRRAKRLLAVPDEACHIDDPQGWLASAAAADRLLRSGTAIANLRRAA